MASPLGKRPPCLAILCHLRFTIQIIRRRKIDTLQWDRRSTIDCFWFHTPIARIASALLAPDWQPGASERHMNMASPSSMGDDVRAEYDESTFANAVRGKYAEAYKTGTN